MSSVCEPKLPLLVQQGVSDVLPYGLTPAQAAPFKALLVSLEPYSLYSIVETLGNWVMPEKVYQGMIVQHIWGGYFCHHVPNLTIVLVERRENPWHKIPNHSNHRAHPTGPVRMVQVYFYPGRAGALPEDAPRTAGELAAALPGYRVRQVESEGSVIALNDDDVIEDGMCLLLIAPPGITPERTELRARIESTPLPEPQQ